MYKHYILNCILFLCLVYYNTGEVALGRGSECEVVIPARSLSRKHAAILIEGGTHFVQDLDSRNKTYRGTVSNETIIVRHVNLIYLVKCDWSSWHSLQYPTRQWSTILGY